MTLPADDPGDAWKAALDWLFALDARRGWDLTIERMQQALERLDHPERRFRSVLVAGTNGKGSTSTLIAASLSSAGYRVGLYTSPHLIELTERVRIEGREIPRAAFLAQLNRLRAELDVEEMGLTFFEVTTLAAFLLFAGAGVEVVVLEVGLGGRLDATNVVEPEVSAITSIGLDHEKFLGSTLRLIAKEKAGVMRSGRPVVLGPTLAADVRRTLHACAAEVQATIIDARTLRERAPPTRWPGLHMRDNAAVALGVLECLREKGFEIPEDRLRLAFSTARWPGRFETIHANPTIVCDGAHNREGVTALVKLLATEPDRRWRILFSAVSDKPWREALRRLAPFSSSLTVTTTGGERGVALDDLRRVAGRLRPAKGFPCAGEALEGLLAEASTEPILVTGSLFLVGEAYAWLARRQGVDRIDAIRVPGAPP